MFMQWVLYHSAASFGKTPHEFQKKLQSVSDDAKMLHFTAFVHLTEEQWIR
jgi:hypothetical protein